MEMREWFAANPEPNPDLTAYAAGTTAIAERLMAADPSLPHITAIIMASDQYGVDRYTRMLRDGVPFESVRVFIGSYHRLDWILAMVDEGLVTREQAMDSLRTEWSASDPDDTDPRFLALWHEAKERNGGTIIDGDPLPDVDILDVYRGQSANDPPGIAWSLSKEVAGRFANGAGYRVPNSVKAPVILHRRLRREDALGYLVQRGEAEVVLDPKELLS